MEEIKIVLPELHFHKKGNLLDIPEYSTGCAKFRKGKE